jgi:hypothetical protein
MAYKEDIIQAIEDRLDSSPKKSYNLWNIGVTADWAECKKRNNYPLHFLCWPAESHQEAVEIKNRFVEKGMTEVQCDRNSEKPVVFIF